MSAVSDKLIKNAGNSSDFKNRPKSRQKIKAHKLPRLSKNCCCQNSKKYTARAPIPIAVMQGINTCNGERKSSPKALPTAGNLIAPHAKNSSIPITIKLLRAEICSISRQGKSFKRRRKSFMTGKLGKLFQFYNNLTLPDRHWWQLVKQTTSTPCHGLTKLGDCFITDSCAAASLAVTRSRDRCFSPSKINLGGGVWRN